MFTNTELLWAFMLTLIAGLSTGIGALIVLAVKHQSKSLLSIGLGFSAGVMLYVSFMEMRLFKKDWNIYGYCDSNSQYSGGYSGRTSDTYGNTK